MGWPIPLDRFQAKYEISETGCWEWRATRIPCGYGMFYFEHRRQLAHRVAYQMFVGPIPDGHELHHTCENKGCVNPSHLVALTRKEHIRLSDNAAAPFINATHCTNGHEFTPENTYRNPRGSRECKACHRAIQARRRAKDPLLFRAKATENMRRWRSQHPERARAIGRTSDAKRRKKTT